MKFKVQLSKLLSTSFDVIVDTEEEVEAAVLKKIKSGDVADLVWEEVIDSTDIDDWETVVEKVKDE